MAARLGAAAGNGRKRPTLLLHSEVRFGQMLPPVFAQFVFALDYILNSMYGATSFLDKSINSCQNARCQIPLNGTSSTRNREMRRKYSANECAHGKQIIELAF
jgi:hypothetical protein